MCAGFWCWRGLVAQDALGRSFVVRAFVEVAVGLLCGRPSVAIETFVSVFG